MTAGKDPTRADALIQPGRRVEPEPQHPAAAADADATESIDPATVRRPVAMTKLQRLYSEQGQSPWLDNLSRDYLRDGTLSRMVAAGVRGVTSNPTIFARAIAASAAYDKQFSWLTSTGSSIEEAYWELVATDVTAACAVLDPVYQSSRGLDGFASVEVAPELASDTLATIAAARRLHDRIDQPNLLVKIPATPEGIPAIRAMIAEGRNINVTLIFSLSRYAQVIEAYLSGLETFRRNGGDPSKVHSVASFFVSRVDTEVNERLKARGDDRAVALYGKAAVAQAKLAYRLFQERFAGQRWQHLESHGANPQRPLWASMSSKNPATRDTRYVDELIGPGTISTLPELTIAAFENHGVLARSIDVDVPEAVAILRRLADAGVDMDDVGRTLEKQGVDAFHQSFQRITHTLDAKKHQLGRV